MINRHLADWHRAVHDAFEWLKHLFTSFLLAAKLRQYKHSLAQTVVGQHHDNINVIGRIFLMNASARKRQLFAGFWFRSQHFVAPPGAPAPYFIPAQSNFFKKVPGIHVSLEGNELHASPMTCSIGDKDSDPKCYLSCFAWKMRRLRVANARSAAMSILRASFDNESQ
jgi:hypothetical protein